MAGIIGTCNVDLNKSIVTMLSCPECKSGLVACHEDPHAHFCLACNFGSVVEEFEDEKG